jgi:hypothetical protein
MPKDQREIVVHLPLLAQLEQRAFPRLEIQQLLDELHDLRLLASTPSSPLVLHLLLGTLSPLEKIQLMLVGIRGRGRGGPTVLARRGLGVEDRGREEMSVLLLLLLRFLLSGSNGGRGWRLLRVVHRRGGEGRVGGRGRGVVRVCWIGGWGKLGKMT